MSDILALAAAMDRLTDAILGNGATLGATAPQAEAAAPPAAKPKTTKGSATTASETTAEQPAPSPDPSPEAADRTPEIKKLVLEIAKGDRPSVVALLAEFGAEKAGDVPIAKHDEFMARLEALKAEGDLA